MGQFLASGTLRPESRNLNGYPPQSRASGRRWTDACSGFERLDPRAGKADLDAGSNAGL